MLGGDPASGSAVEKGQAAPSKSSIPATAPSAKPPAGLSTTTPPPVPDVDPAELAAAHTYTKMFYDGKLDLLFAKFTEEMQTEIIPMERLNLIFEHVVTNYGAETRVIAEEKQARDDLRAFVRWARFDKTEEVIEVQWILKANDEIAGFYIRPAKKKIISESPRHPGTLVPPDQSEALSRLSGLKFSFNRRAARTKRTLLLGLERPS